MISKEQLAEAIRVNREQMDTTREAEVSPLPALMVEVGVEPDAAFEAAQAQARTALAWTTNRSIDELTPDVLEANAQFLSHAASMFLEGLAAGLRAQKEGSDD